MKLNIPDITRKITRLYNAIKHDCESPEEIAGKINDILLHGEKIPQQLLSSAWDYFAQKKGVQK